MKKQVDWTKEEIKALLESNDKAVMRGLIVITSLQTASERETHNTVELNGVGWNKIDADLMTSFVEQVRAKRWLSAKQLKATRARLMKYAGQLAKVANGNVPVTT